MAATLVELVEHAFADQGPLHRAKSIGMGKTLLPHRWDQARAAIEVADHIQAGRGTHGASIMPLEVGAGQGKTLIIGIVAALYCALDRQSRVLISSYTLDQRGELLRELPLIQAVIEETLKAFHLPTRDITMAERRAMTDYVSPLKMRRLALQVFTNPKDQKSQAALLAWYEGLDPKKPNFGELKAFFDASEDGRLPAGMTVMDICLGPDDKDEAIYQLAMEARMAAHRADIVLVTHAMLLYDTIFWGKVLTTKTTARVFGPLLIDEADRLSQAASTIDTITVDLPAVRELLLDVNAHYSAVPEITACVAVAHDALLMVWRITDGQKIGKATARQIRADDAIIDVLEAALKAVALALREVAIRLDPEGAIWDDLLLMNARSFQAISDIRQLGASHALVITYRNVSGGALRATKRLSIQSFRTRYLPARLWSPAGPHPFSSITFLSATLSGRHGDEDFDYFCRSIALPAARIDRTGTPPNTRHFGKIWRIVYGDRNERYLWTDKTDADWINPDAVQYCVEAIVYWYSQVPPGEPDQRLLVLFPSYPACAAVEKSLNAITPSLPLHVQGKGDKASSMVGNFAYSVNGIWLGVAWEGMNLVHPVTQQTLVTTVMIPRIPVPPSDPMMPKDAAERAREEARRKTLQGIARGLRTAGDVIDLWMLDPRFALDPEYRKIVPHLPSSIGDLNGVCPRGDQVITTHKDKHRRVRAIFRNGTLEDVWP